MTLLCNQDPLPQLPKVHKFPLERGVSKCSDCLDQARAAGSLTLAALQPRALPELLWENQANLSDFTQHLSSSYSKEFQLCGICAYFILKKKLSI